MASNKMCPLLLASSNDYVKGEGCREKDCAWWNPNMDECSVRAIATSLNNINETLQWAARLNH